VDNELEVIRDEMELTRANLADKLGALETQVRETVSDAKEAVSSTVEGVKEVVGSVTETVGSVAEQFSVSKQVDEHPWLAMGAAVAAGFVAAQVLDQLGQQQTPAAPSSQSFTDLPLTSTRFSEPPAEAKKEGLLESMMPELSGVANTLLHSASTLALSSLMGVIRELAVRGLSPEWKGEVTKLVDQVASQLGSRPLDETRSEQLLGALGIGEKKEGRPQEGAPYDPARQRVGAGNGPQSGRFANNR
jgi:ElaB/YqjD/DUF883 family membrane-anchored ribosome-binding protein